MPLEPLCILIDCDNLRIRENRLGFVVHTAQVIAGKKRSSEQRPKRHVREIFVMLHSAIANLKHVGIIPMSRAGEFLEAVLTEADHRHAVIVIADVSSRAPEVPRLRTPNPWCFHSPVAYAEDHGAFRLRESFAEFGVLYFWVQAFSVAPIDLYVIDIAVGISVYV